MEHAIQKAKVLVEALNWIRQFRDRYVVVKLGGSALEEPDAVRSCLRDVIFMEAVGMRPILVHGGGKSINRAMEAAGIKPRFVQGRRYTDDATLEIVAKTRPAIANRPSRSISASASRISGTASIRLPKGQGNGNSKIRTRQTKPISRSA